MSAAGAARWIARVAFVVMVLSWALATGRYTGPDEPAHVLRAAAVAQGDLLGEPAPALPNGYRVVEVPAALTQGDPACFRHDSRVTTACALPSATAVGRTRAATSAGRLPPPYFATIGVLVRLVGDPTSAAWYRAVSAAIVAAVLLVAAERLRVFGAGATAALVVLTPAAWFLLGVVNPNAIEFALAVLAWVGVARLRYGLTLIMEWWWVSLPLAVAITCRPPALMAAVAVVMVVVSSVQMRPGQFLVLAGPPLAGLTAIGVWAAWSGLRLDDPRTAQTTGIASALAHAVRAVPDTFGEMIRSLGWLEHCAPAIATLAWFVGLVVCVTSRERRSASGSVGWFAVLVGLPVAFEVVANGAVGPIWQGRYSLPTFAGILVFLVPTTDDRSARVVVLATAAVTEMCSFWWTVRRSVVGTAGSWWFHGRDVATPILPPLTWVALNAAAAVAVTVIVGRTWLLDVAEHVDDDVGTA